MGCWPQSEQTQQFCGGKQRYVRGCSGGLAPHTPKYEQDLPCTSRSRWGGPGWLALCRRCGSPCHMPRTPASQSPCWAACGAQGQVRAGTPPCVHIPVLTRGLGAHLQVWHTLHSGHCQPERLRGVREMSRQAPWKCCPQLVQNTRSRRSPGPLHTEHRASSVSHEKMGSGLSTRGVLPCQDPLPGQEGPSTQGWCPQPHIPMSTASATCSGQSSRRVFMDWKQPLAAAQGKW